MTPGKAGGLLGEPLKGASKPLAASRQRERAGSHIIAMSEHLFEQASFKLKHRTTGLLDRRKGQTFRSPPAKPGVYLTELILLILNNPVNPVNSSRLCGE